MVKKMVLLCLVAMMCAASAFAVGTSFDFKRAVPRGFGKDLTRAMMMVDSKKTKYPPGQTPPLEFLDTLNRAFAMLGLDYSGSIEKTLGGASGQELMQLSRNGIMDTLYLPLEYTENKGMMDEAIKKGLLTNQAAIAASDAANLLGRNWSWKATSTPAASPSFEKYLGTYTYLGDTCSGELTFAKDGQFSYVMLVDTACESGGTCGGVFEVTPSSENNGIATLTNAEYGITLAVSSKGITVDNVPVGICGMGAYIQGDYAKGKVERRGNR